MFNIGNIISKTISLLVKLGIVTIIVRGVRIPMALRILLVNIPNFHKLTSKQIVFGIKTMVNLTLNQNLKSK